MATLKAMLIKAATKALALTETSGRIAHGGLERQQLMVANRDTANACWLQLGGSSVTAVQPVSGGATGGFYLGPQSTIIVTLDVGQTYIAGICASGLTATIDVTVVEGF